MAWLRTVCLLLGVFSANLGHTLTPLPDSKPAFFSGDWVGTGGDDVFCFMRLRTDGTGTVLVSSPSGDWLGANIRWLNQRQSIILVDTAPVTADPHRRLTPLRQLSLSSGINQTIRLKLNEEKPACELQLRVALLRRADKAETLIDNPTDLRNTGGRH